MNRVNQSFNIKKEIYILIVFSILVLLLIEYLNLDFYLADLIYQPTASWFYRDHMFTNLIVHRIGKYLMILIYLVFLVTFWFKDKTKENKFKRHGQIVLLISILLGTLMVSVLKHSLNVDCPWDLLQYGGDKPYFSLFSYNSSYLPSSHCFPSGHASSAFTWIALYFYASIYYPQHRFKILAAVLIIGFGFGLSQQFRGAHFLSHDFWSLLVCTFVNIVIYSLAFNKFMLSKVYFFPVKT
jgi:membrane-associated PAP2 superfamily phosphatase